MYIIGEEEIEAVAGLIRSGGLFRYGHGDACTTFEKRYAEYLGGRHFRLTCSGSYALHAALVGLGIGPGDEVIVPAHTYMATATSVLSVGAIPVIAGKTGRHTYTEWDQVLMGEGAGHPAMNPYAMPANAACRREVTRDMLPRSLEILARMVMIPTDPRHDDEHVEKTVRGIEAAARFAFGATDRGEAEAAASEIGDAESIDPRKYDTDVAAYGLDA